MKTIRIPAMDIAARHPLGMKFTTDGIYARFATNLADLLVKQNIQGFEGKNARELAIVLTMYYEDVVSDLGIWHSFTTRMHELYGRYLPFFDIDETKYYRDEPNNVDVRFLIWLFISRTERGSIIAPDTLAIEYASEVVGRMMDEQFEMMPVNEELKRFFTSPEWARNFFHQRDILKWFFFSNYLTCNENATDIAMQQGLAFSRNMKCPTDLAFRISECVAVYENKLQPLAMRAQEWMQLILDYNGRPEEARKIGEQEYMPFDFYKIVEAERGKGIKFESIDGKKFMVHDEDFGQLSDECYDKKTVFTLFVKYGDRYYLGTESSWAPDTAAFDAERKQRKQLRNQCIANRRVLISDNGGSPLYYFENGEELKKFLREKVGMPQKRIDSMPLPKDHTITYTLFVRQHDDNVCFYPDVAKYIKDEKNPYYDEAYAKQNTFSNLFALDGAMVRYLIENNMLPEATINCEGGETEGKRLVHDNFDFFARMMQGNLYSQE